MKTPSPEPFSDPRRVWPQVFSQSAKPDPIIAPMTVGIAAICDGGKAIVMAADRMSVLGTTGLSLDTTKRKIVSLGPGAAVAATGTAGDSELVLDRMRHSAELMATAAVLSIAERMQSLSARVRATQIEQTITRPYLKMSFAQFAKLATSTNNPQVVVDVIRLIQNYQFQLQLIVAGLDVHGAHLYCVSHDGIGNHTSTGFVAIGIGAGMALHSIIGRGKLFPSMSLAEAMYSIYAVKRLTESITAVGPATDIAVIRLGEQAHFITPDDVKTLSKIHRRMKPRKLSSDDAAAIEGFLK